MTRGWSHRGSPQSSVVEGKDVVLADLERRIAETISAAEATIEQLSQTLADLASLRSGKRCVESKGHRSSGLQPGRSWPDLQTRLVAFSSELAESDRWVGVKGEGE